jgi:hypothetical protein
MTTTFIRRIENNQHTDYPSTSLYELQYWIRMVTESGYLKQQEEKGITFKLMEV